MAMAGYVLDMPTKMDHHLGLLAKAKGPTAFIEAVQRYLASWTKERIANVQRIDAGWAPFDVIQRPLQVNGVLDVRCIRDAIHAHCIALNEAGETLTPELVELDEFFFAAAEIAEQVGKSSLQARTPPTPLHGDVFSNW